MASLHFWRCGVVVAGTDEEGAAPGINRRRLPYRAAALLVRPAAVVGHVEGLPKHRTVLRIESYYAPAKAATRICGIRCQTFFARRDPDVNYAVENNGGSRNDCRRMTVHLGNPPERSSLPIYCDHVRAVVHLVGTENISNN